HGRLPDGPYTVARAMVDYLDDYRRRGGKSVEGIESVVNRNILPELGKLAVSKLTPQRLRDWHRGLAERGRYRRSRNGAAERHHGDGCLLYWRCHFQVPAKCVDQLYLPGRPAFGFCILRGTNNDRYALGAGGGDVEPVEAVKEFHAARRV